ncbi:Calx-beta domain-containing protein [Azospirillum sp.]|uniref:Calx-beta domain-containing protein n=1 Tax=Azospirillum sp. TaxID=34012 RepID=UPI002D707259|nr:DUF4347 domain-containing protein [Azospirillum sp.]HYD70014.1 DUF4347 domain-containing protein [Azospirillum sp.]
MREVLLADAQLPDLDLLLAQRRPEVEVVLVPGTADAHPILAAVLAQRPAAVHLLAHGEPGRVLLGAEPITAASLCGRTWPDAAGTGILIHACRTGAGEDGRSFVERLAQATGARVAAATHLVGHADLGGSWELDMATGPACIRNPFIAADAWPHILALASFGPSPVSQFLRSHQGNMTVRFDLGFDGTEFKVETRILLKGDDPEIFQQLWEQGIERIWNNKYSLSNEDGQYAIRFDVQFTSISPHYDVSVHSGPGRSYMSDWYLDMGWGADYPEKVAAHEYGHMIGAVDEYLVYPDYIGYTTASTLMSSMTERLTGNYVDLIAYIAEQRTGTRLDVIDESGAGAATSLSIAAVRESQDEGNASVTPFLFTVTRTGDLSGSTTAEWVVSGSGPNWGHPTDFDNTLPRGIVSFSPGETHKTITVSVTGDTAVEYDEGFLVMLTNPSGGAAVTVSTATAVIRNDDSDQPPLPSLSIAAANADRREGDAGTTPFTFTLTRTGDTAGESVVHWSVTGTGANPAAAADFGGSLPGGTVTFATGETAKTISVAVSGDTAMEGDEGFRVSLSDATGAMIAVASADGLIRDDDATPPPATFGMTRIEQLVRSHEGNTEISFDLGFDGAAFNVVTRVQLTGDDPGPFATWWEHGIERIWNNQLSLSDGAHQYPIRFDVQFVTADPHYTVQVHTGIGQFDMGNWRVQFPDDPLRAERTTAHEYGHMIGAIDEYPIGPTYDAYLTTGTLMSDLTERVTANYVDLIDHFAEVYGGSPLDVVPSAAATASTTLSIRAGTPVLAEGNAGPTAFTFTVTRAGDTSGAVSADWIVSGSRPSWAHSSDLGDRLPRGSVSFAAGETTKTITVAVTGDRAVEDDEGFLVMLTNPSGEAAVAVSTATAVIRNDDSDQPPPPSLFIALAYNDQYEGTTRDMPFVFFIERDGDTSGPSTVHWSVSGFGANPADAADFGGALPSGSVTFAEGANLRAITVMVSADSVVEPDEGFRITLSNASGATIAISSTNGTIRNDDWAPPPVTGGNGGGGGAGGAGGGGGSGGGGGGGGGGTPTPPADPVPPPVPGAAETVLGSSNADVLTGAAGNDVLSGAEGDDSLVGGLGDDALYGNPGGDALYGNQGMDALFGGQGADSLFGGQDADTLFGNMADDVLYGNMAGDRLFGGQGSDTIFGGQGDDALAGNLGNDTLAGNLGADTFVFAPGGGSDVVADFRAEQGDRLQVAAGMTWTIGDGASGAVVTFSTGDQVILIGIRAPDVSAAWFVAA